MTHNNNFLLVLAFLGLFDVTSSKHIESPRASQGVHNTTKGNNTLPIESSRFQGLTPVVITCAVLLQILLPLIYWLCYRCCKSCRKDVQDTERSNELGDSIVETYEVDSPCCRIISLHYYYSFFLWFIYLICYNVLDWSRHGVVFKNLHIMAIVVIVFSFLLVIIESLLSREYEHIDNFIAKEDVLEYIKTLRTKPPVIKMSVECYHLEDRPRTNGEGTKLKKIVTYSGTREFSFGRWEDLSTDELPYISAELLTRVKIDAYIEFGDIETKEDFERQKKEYYDAFRYFDKSFSFKVDREIPDLKTRVLAFVDTSQQIGWISPKYFWCATCCCLTWPYRCLFRAKTAKCRYDLKKKIFMTGNSPSSVVSMEPTDNTVMNKSSPSYVMSDLSNNEEHAFPNTTSQQAFNPGADSITNQKTAYSLANQEIASSLTNQAPPFLAANHESAYHSTNQGLSYPLANQRESYAYLMQPEEMPDIPPPSYDVAVDSSNSAFAS